MPPGASGSSTTSTKLAVLGGAPDQAGQLSLADLQGFVQTNANLNPVIGYYKSRFEARVSAKPAVIPDYLLAAAETFKKTVGALGDKDELKSWKQLATGADGAGDSRLASAGAVREEIKCDMFTE